MFYIKIGGAEFIGSSLDSLIENVKIVHPNLDEQFVRKSAKQSETGKLASLFKFFDVKKPNKKTVSFSEGLTGAKALLKNVIGLGVSQSEINRRAVICEGCPMFGDFSDCMACGAAARINAEVEKLKSFVGMSGKYYPNDLKSKSCGHCGCALSVMLGSQLTSFSKSKEGISETRPAHCWLNPHSENFKLDSDGTK